MSESQTVSQEQARWIALRALKFPEKDASYDVAVRKGKLSDRGPGYSTTIPPAKRLDRSCWIVRVHVSRKEDAGFLRCPTPVTDVWVDQCTGEVLRIDHGVDNEGVLTRPYRKRDDPETNQ